MIANTAIAAALRSLLVIPSGGTPSTQQYADGLEVLNDGINMWSAQGNLTYEDTLENLTIPVSTQSITIGATGTLVTGRPLDIIEATIIENDQEYDLDVSNDLVASDKTITSRPEKLYYRKTYPDGRIYFDVTTDKEYTLQLKSLKNLATFTDGTTDNPLPPHYETALKANLKIWLADEMGAGNRVTPSMIELARESKQTIIGQALTIRESRTELSNRENREPNTDR